MDYSKQAPREIVKPLMPFKREEWSNIDKISAFVIFLMHVPCIFAPSQFTWGAILVALVLYVITGLFGITISYHRHLSHKSFKIPKWLEYLFAYCGVHALQGDPMDWVSTHRCHHQFVDTDKDPHSPIQGFWFGHITWALNSYLLTKKVCPQYFRDFKGMERNILMLNLKHGRPTNVVDLEKQTFYRFIQKTYFLHPIALALLLYAIGGFPFVIWGMCVRITVFIHVMFMVNSVGHRWGTRQWSTSDLSTNNWWLSLLSFGEGWHNNHHAFEYSARHGLEWWQIDFSWYVIIFLQAIGLATDVKLPSQSHKERLAMDKLKDDTPK
ncbi:unnamed protein product [Citrullus colocynthis]|uniref:Fatty acid desaturase domain-containing protein n=1 Tax=Citrullus colocynthis TaxID=252529 RepID=A0ABP0YVK7_9ROSI